jgi:hypothetical protein
MILAAVLVACAFAVEGQQNMFKIDLVPSGTAVSLDEPILTKGVYVFKAWPDGVPAKLPQTRVKRITQLTGKAADTVYQIDLNPSGTVIAKDNPTLKGPAYVFHTWRGGTFTSLRKSDVRKITPVTGDQAFWIEQGLMGETVISGNLAMEDPTRSSRSELRRERDRRRVRGARARSAALPPTGTGNTRGRRGRPTRTVPPTRPCRAACRPCPRRRTAARRRNSRRTTRRLPMKKIAFLFGFFAAAAASAQVASYQIDLAPSGRMLSIDQPVLKGGSYQFQATRPARCEYAPFADQVHHEDHTRGRRRPTASSRSAIRDAGGSQAGAANANTVASAAAKGPELGEGFYSNLQFGHRSRLAAAAGIRSTRIRLPAVERIASCRARRRRCPRRRTV